MSEKDRETNERMVRLFPELESKHATYPLKRQKWLAEAGSVGSNDGTSTPAFLPYDKDPNFDATLKPDYAWGPGPRGFGYYHMLTRQSYKILYARAKNNPAPIQCCCFGSPELKLKVEDLDIVSDILYNRSIASIPDDMLAAKEAIDIARGEAKAHYNMDQNVQLFFLAT